MNLMWFENFWMVDGVAFVLVLAICSFFVLDLFSMFAFGSSLLSVFNFSFVVLVVIVLNFGFSVLFLVWLVLISTILVSVTTSSQLNLSISVSNSSFSGVIALFLSKGSNLGAFAPFSNWDFEPYGWELWRNPLEFEFLLAGSNSGVLRPPLVKIQTLGIC